jgi:hypothetical protein
MGEFVCFCALASTVMHELCEIETDGNSIDSHAECTPQRQGFDQEDLTLIIRNLRSEDLFNMKNDRCRKLRSGMIFHEDIINSVCALHERGTDALEKYITERLTSTTKKVEIDAPLKAMPRLSKSHLSWFSEIRKKSFTIRFLLIL